MNRIVSLILIVGVLLCTFSCAAGNCCAVSSVALSGAEAVTLPAKNCCRHCRKDNEIPGPFAENSKPPASHSSGPDPSGQEPNAETCICQGVCSGMVRTEPIELPTADGFLMLSLTVELPTLSGGSCLMPNASADGLPGRMLASGLAMRVRVCSLTC